MKKTIKQYKLKFRKRLQNNSKPIFMTGKIGLLGILLLLANICLLTAFISDANAKEYTNDAKQKRVANEQQQRNEAVGTREPKKVLALADWIVPAVMAGSNLIKGLFDNQQARKEAKAMRDYNSPKAQMQRYTEAGLSPYLIYGAANAGNMSQPMPERQMPDFGKSIGDYMAWTNFGEDIKAKRLTNAMLAKQNSILIDKKNTAQAESMLKEANAYKSMLELYSDYPDSPTETGYDRFTPDNFKTVAGTGFRRKLNEVKNALALSNVQRIETAIEGMNSKNIVERVKAKYAEDFGMVGGDWTQGLGLIKSIPTMFKGARKIPAQEKALIDSYRKFKGDQYKRNANRFLFEQLKP